MKKIIFFAAIAATMLLASCMKDNGNGYNNYGNNSNVTFWMAANCSTTPVVVTVDSQTSQISQYYPNGAPYCGGVGCANFNLPAGTYNYIATGSDSTWRGSVTVAKSGCVFQQIQCTPGTITFWVDSAANNIKVTLNGGTSRITVSFPTTTPTCGTAGCATFNMPAGTYNYTAITAANVGYNGSVTVQNDSCALVKLF
jgi:hypothetical protein